MYWTPEIWRAIWKLFWALCFSVSQHSDPQPPVTEAITFSTGCDIVRRIDQQLPFFTNIPVNPIDFHLVKPCTTAMRATARAVRNLAFTKYAHWIRKWANGQDSFRAVNSMPAFERGHLWGVRSWYRRSDLFVKCLISGFTPDGLKIWILSRPFR